MKHYKLQSRDMTRRFLKAPNKEKVEKARVEGEGPAVLRSMVEVFSALDPVHIPPRRNGTPPLLVLGTTGIVDPPIVVVPAVQRPGRDVLLSDKTPVVLFTVKRARVFLDKKTYDAHAVQPNTKQIYKQAPVYKNMRLRQRVSPDHEDPRRITLPDSEWNVIFKHLHAKQRRTNEKDFLYELVHHCINTNAIKSKYAGKNLPSACRRCTPAVVESRTHAFHECTTVAEAWVRIRAWSKFFSRHSTYQSTKSVSCWPSVASLPSIMIHLHSVITNSIWRTYCQLGDEEILEEGGLRWMMVKIELRRAKYRDMLLEDGRSKRILIGSARVDSEGRNEVSDDSEPVIENVLAVIAEWHHPPHIIMTREGVEFSDMWETT
ncbi:hypothetical protein BGX27_003546 [Mortierella sp. AM989]|nr:hypothetical protein BGX27_003546 [Mortierella sp. AM989]